MSWVIISRIRSAVTPAAEITIDPDPAETGYRSDPARGYLLAAAIGFMALCVWIGEVLR